jgi:3-deoxy-D-manno-octulosonic-acid transferase
VILKLYETLMNASGPFLTRLLEKRCRKGKEDRQRLPERTGHASRFRAKGKLVWFHAASVGEAQSTLTLIDALLARNPALHILVTTGTVSSANLMQRRLPPHTIHQYYPLDRPEWVKAFLDHWTPDLVLWMESEIWPSMLSEIKARNIPAALINARLSSRSFRRWRLARPFIRRILSTFSLILAQGEEDAAHLRALGAQNVQITDNLKYSAEPLPCDQDILNGLQNLLDHRPVWLYASTHAGEEEMACRLHARLKLALPGLLTIIVPRHPERRAEILQHAESTGLKARLRSANPRPDAQDDIYIADTLGELGLFYRLCPITCIGRSFSHDGGGGHNPIEAALLGCAVLHGPHVQNLARIFRDIDQSGAALAMKDETELARTLQRLLQNPAELRQQQQKASRFAGDKEKVLDLVLTELDPLLARLDPPTLDPSGERACA